MSYSLKISLSLNSSNYALWCRMMKVAIGGKCKALLHHLTTNSPDSNDENYEQWEHEDLIVFSWLIQNIEPGITSNLNEFSTSKAFWDALATTYSSGKEKLHTFDLHVNANDIKHKGMSLENLWITFQGIWGEIERREPNPMKCDVGINTYNQVRLERKLFQFLNSLDQKHDSIKLELLRLDPLPSVEEAYAKVIKEVAHQQILGQSGIDSSSSQGITTGLVATKPIRYASQLQRVDKSKLKYSECRKSRHTNE
ncbi:uncharacterized protein [Rutidosis leptorrhynchoides]|uniref:uncharacterized protein n=1 Tax=Rutidosis leptorrhynchoides TaxID=125765 RepID=UPI003A99D66A